MSVCKLGHAHTSCPLGLGRIEHHVCGPRAPCKPTGNDPIAPAPSNHRAHVALPQRGGKALAPVCAPSRCRGEVTLRSPGLHHLAGEGGKVTPHRLPPSPPSLKRPRLESVTPGGRARTVAGHLGGGPHVRRPARVLRRGRQVGGSARHEWQWNCHSNFNNPNCCIHMLLPFMNKGREKHCHSFIPRQASRLAHCYLSHYGNARRLNFIPIYSDSATNVLNEHLG